jgi:hypothetical protein
MVLEDGRFGKTAINQFWSMAISNYIQLVLIIPMHTGLTTFAIGISPSTLVGTTNSGVFLW